MRSKKFVSASKCQVFCVKVDEAEWTPSSYQHAASGTRQLAIDGLVA
jgi:hypothetical protein